MTFTKLNLYKYFTALFFILAISIAEAQVCTFATGNQGSSKALASRCAPNTVRFTIQFEFDAAVTTEPAWDPNDVDFRINWGDGSPVKNVGFPELGVDPELISFVYTFPNVFGNHGFEMVLEHQYNPGADCSYEATATLKHGPDICAGFVQTQIFESWSTDNQNGGNLALDPNVFFVCQGEDFSLTFDDVSTFNCNDDLIPTPAFPNEERRWVRFQYGDVATTAAGRIPNVNVGGVPVTDAGGNLLGAGPGGVHFDNQGPGANGVIVYPPPSENPSATTLTVSMISTGAEQVGDRFAIVLQNWNECNRFIVGDPPIEEIAYIEIIASPPPPTAASPTFCETGVGNLTANGTGGTLTWYDADPDPGPANVLGTGGTFAHGETAPGVYTFFVTETLGNNCEGPATQVDLTIVQDVTNSNAGPDQTVCDITTATLAGNNPAVGVGTWTVFGGGATVTSPNDPNSGVTGLTPGINRFRWTIDNGPCTDNDVIVIFRDQTPTVVDAGPDQDICGATSTNFAGTAVDNNGTGTWEVVTNQIWYETFDNLGFGTTADGAPTGWTLVDTDPGAPGNTDFIGINGNEIQGQGIRNDEVVWTSDVINIAAFTSVDASVDLRETGNLENADYIRVFYRLDGGPETFFTTNGNNVNDFNTRVASVAGLTGTTIQIVIRMLNSATNESYFFDNVFVWETRQGPDPSISNPNSPTSFVSGLNVGPNVFRWTVESEFGSCNVQFDEVTITRDRAVTADAGTDQILCSTTITNLAADPAANGGTGMWTLVSGLGTEVIVDPTDPNTQVTGLQVGGGGADFRWTVTSEFGICPSADDVVNVFVDPSPGVSVAANGPYSTCGNEDVTLGATGTFTTVTWSTSGDGSFDNANDPNAVYTPGPGDQGAGTVTLSIITDDPPGVCPAATDMATLTVLPVPAANDQNLTLCETTAGSGNTLNYDLTSNEGAINGGGGITYSYFEDVNLTVPVGVPTDVTITTGDDYFVLVDDGTCQDTARLDFTVNTLPTANDQNPAECEDSFGSGVASGINLTLLQGPINGGGGITYSYFEDAGLTTPVADPTNVAVSNADDFFVVVDDGTCNDVAVITYTVNPLPVANDVAPTGLCEDTSGSAQIASYNLRSNEAAINGGVGINYSYFQDANLTMLIGTPGNFTVNDGDNIFVLVGDGTCLDTAVLTININSLPTANDLSFDLCEDVALSGQVSGVDLTANEPAINGGGGITYSYFEDAGLTTPVGTPANVTVNNGDDFFVEVDDGTCTSVAQLDYNIFQQAVVNAAAVATVIVPGGTIDLSPSTSGGTTGSITWTTSGDGTFLPNAFTLGAIYDPGPTDEAVLPSTITLTLTSDDPAGPCPAGVSSIMISISDPATADAGPDQEICADATATMAGSIGGTASSLTWTTSGDGTFDDPTNANAIYTPGATDISGAPQVITLTITTDDPDGAGPILPATDDMLLSINPLPVTAAPVGTTTGCINDVINYVIPGAPATSTFAWDLTDLPGAVVTAGGDPLPFITLQFTSALSARSLTVTETETVTATNCVGLPVSLGGIDIFDPPTVDAGSDETTCEGVAFDLSGSATPPSQTNGSGISWTHNGTGFFTDATVINPIYNPGVGETGVVTLTLTVSGNAGCPDVVDDMNLTINPVATVGIGVDLVTCENTAINLNGVVGGTFTDLLWTSSTGLGTFSDPTITNPTYTADPADFGSVITLRLTATDASGTCPPVFDELDLTINQVPVVSGGANQTVCEGDVVNLTGTISVAGYNALWTGGTGAFADDTDVNTTYTPGPFDVGAVVLTLTATDPSGACADVSNTVTITFEAPPTSVAGSDEETCEGVPFDLSTSGTTPAPTNFSSLMWTTSGTGTFDDPTLQTPIYTPGVGETGIITLTLEAFGNATCTSVTDDMQLTITTGPTANAGSDEEICEGVAFNLSTSATPPNATDFSSVMWTTSGTGSFNNNALLTPIYIPGAGDEGTVVTLTLEVFGNGTCPSVTDDMQLTVTLAPVVDAGSDEETCEGTPFDLSTSGTVPTDANGASRMWSHTGTGSFDDPTLLTPIYTPGAGETGTITLTLEVFGNGSCVSVTDDMDLTITPLPTVSAGSDEEVCEGAGFNLSFSTALPNASDFSSLLWTTSGTGTFNNASLLTPVYTPGAGDEGTVVTLTIEAFGNGSCASVTDDMLLTVTLAPIADAGSDEETCEGVAFDLSTSAVVPTESNAVSRLWTHTGTGSFDNPTILTPIYTPGPGETGAVTFTLEVFGNGSCTSVTDNMTLVITALPVVDAGSDEETCEGVAYNLASSGTLPNVSNAASLNWTHTGTGSFDDPTLLLPTYTPGAGETGAVTFTLEGVGNGSCPSVTDNMTLTITPAPVVDAGSDEETCQGVAFDLSTSATLPSEANGSSRMWTHTGTGSFDDPTLLTPIYTPGIGETGFVTFTLEVFGNGSCPSATDIMTLTITAPPIVFAGSDQETCEAVPFDLSTSGVLPLANNFSTLMWTTSGTGSFDDPTLLTPIYTPGAGETGVITLTLEAFGNGSCPSATDAMQLTVTPAVTANAGSDEETCEGVPFDLSLARTPATAADFSLLQWTTSGTGNFNNNTLLTPIYIPGAADAGTVVTLTLEAFGNGSCVSVVDDFQLTVTLAPTVDAGSNEETCEGIPFDLSTSGTVPSEANSSSRMWTHTGTGSFDDPTLLTPIYTPGAGETGSVTFTLEVFGNGSCTSVTDNMLLIITPAPVVDAGSDEETCEGSLYDLSTAGTPATAGNFSGLQWTTSGTGTFNNASLLTPIYFPSAADAGTTVTLTLEAFGNGSCVSITDAMQLTITSAPTVDAGSNEETCEGTPFDLSGSAVVPSATNFSSVTWTHTGVGSFDNPNALTPIYTPGVGETGVISLNLEAFGNGSCTSLSDFMLLTITPAPIVDAGADSETCEGTDFNLVSSAIIPSASNVSGLNWTHNGTGSFNDPTILLPTYTPGAGETGVITLTLEGFGNGSCLSITDNMQLTITPAPIVDAGSDEETCQGVAFDLSTSVTVPSELNGNGTRLWTHNGTGSFNDASLLTPIYTPGIGETGTVTLTLLVFGNGSCTPSNDAMQLTITPLPSAFAGSDQETCEAVPFDISTSGIIPIANNFSSLMWTTSGTGTFDDPTLLTPIYTPGAGETGVVTLTLEAFGNGSCTSATDDMLLTVTPAVIVDAGSDEETCEGIPFDLSTAVTPATASNFSNLQWTTSGTGNFTNSSLLTPLYIPGAGDAGTVVTLTLEAFGNGSCVSITDNMQLTVTLAPISNAGSDEKPVKVLLSIFLLPQLCLPKPMQVPECGLPVRTGTFDDPTLLTPIYTPGAGETGVIALTLEIFGNGSCTSDVDNMQAYYYASTNCRCR